MDFFSNGDQDAMVYLLHEDERFADPDFYTRLPYTAFNTRPFHFTERPDEHFLVHFTGHNKRSQVKQFAKKFGLSEALVPDEVLAGMHGLRQPQAPSLLSRVAGLAIGVGNRLLPRR